MKYEPNKENRTQKTANREVFYFCNSEGKPVYKSKEISGDKITFYPYSPVLAEDNARPKRIKVVEFKGWKKIEDLPRIFKKTPLYGFNFVSNKQFLNPLYKIFPRLEKVTISKTAKTRYSDKSITYNWNDLNLIIKKLKRENDDHTLDRKYLINEIISNQTGKVQKLPRVLKAGELEEFISKFTSYEKISTKDIDSLTRILTDLPTSKITATSHVIKTKEKLDSIYLEDIIAEFDNLMKSKPADEEAWQKYFEINTWTLNHLFPYEVILSKGKAYVGGKTFEDDEGRIVDFLFQTGFKDNFALLEIKPPSKQLLKKATYRNPDVFPVTDDLSGGVNQCLDQKDIFLRDMGQKKQSLDPKCILVIGRKDSMNVNQAKCFELYRANQKNIDIVTYDELRAKLQGLHDVITGKIKRKAKS